MSNLESKKWEYKRVIYDGEEFFISDLNIWSHKWELTGKSVMVKDPRYRTNPFVLLENQLQSNYSN